jgi:CheY-like chemotaxis protein
MGKGESAERPAVILLVEDDPGDQELTRRALAEGGLLGELKIVSDGEEALDYLQRKGRYGLDGNAPRPDLILLDLNLPRIDGRQVLQAIRADVALRHLVVVVLTTSSAEEDVLRSYQDGANSFLTKPAGLPPFLTMVRDLGTYWLSLVTLPPQGV